MHRDRAVRIHRSFRKSRRTAREAHRGRRALVDLALRKIRGLRAREQVLVLDRPLGCRPLSDRDEMLEPAAPDEALAQWPEHLVRDQHPVARVRRDVREVVRVEAEVERVRDHPAGRDPDVRLQVLKVVPAERGDAVAVPEPELVPKGRGQPLRPGGEVRVRVAMPPAVGESRDDLLVAEKLLAASQNRRHVQLVVHVQAVHVSLLVLRRLAPTSRRTPCSVFRRAARRRRRRGAWSRTR